MAKYRIPRINRVFLVGHSTGDTNLLFTTRGNPYCMFTLAVNRNYRDKETGEWKEQTEFISVQLVGRNAERICDRVKKGTPLYIEGKLHTYKKDVMGKNITHTIVVAQTAQILHSPEREETVPPTETNMEGFEDNHPPIVEEQEEGELPSIEPEEETPF